MKLTDKAKEHFKKWYLNWIFMEKTFLSLKFSDEQIISNWESLHASEKWGVLVDFFDSKGIHIEIRWDTDEGLVFTWGYAIVGSSGVGFETVDDLKSRYSARTESIKKADEILNNLLNESEKVTE